MVQIIAKIVMHYYTRCLKLDPCTGPIFKARPGPLIFRSTPACGPPKFIRPGPFRPADIQARPGPSRPFNKTPMTSDWMKQYQITGNKLPTFWLVKTSSMWKQHLMTRFTSNFMLCIGMNKQVYLHCEFWHFYKTGLGRPKVYGPAYFV